MIELYNKLENKTVCGNVIIQNVYGKAGVYFAKSIGGVFTLRLQHTSNHFGNPFSSYKSICEKQNLILTNNTKESVCNYFEWVLNGYGDLESERRLFILKVLEQGVLKNKPLVYYKELNQPSHANALDYLINKLF